MTGSGRCEDYHCPVMTAEVVEWLALAPRALVVDATVGGGGHAEAILEAAPQGVEFIGIDRDPEALAAAQSRLDRPGWLVRLLAGRMGEIGRLLEASGVEKVQGMLADLGVSSHQLESPSRGFSFRHEGPLDMRMDPSHGEGAAELLERLDEQGLEQILSAYGEERRARAVARGIMRHPGIRTTCELARIVAEAFPMRERHGRIHPATRTFQALRIAVNDELGELERFLEEAPRWLGRGGRLVVISYHSLEDRRVKRAFRALAAGGDFSLPVRRPIRPGEEELSANKRARSAKMRVLEQRR